MLKFIKKYFFKNNHLQFAGPYENWEEAVKNSTGYSSRVVLSKVEKAVINVLNDLSVYERDGTNFETLPDKIVFQGNLDPIKLLAGGSEMINATLSIMEDMKDKKFIFNLGHGILPRTPIDNVKQCIDLVKNFKD